MITRNDNTQSYSHDLFNIAVKAKLINMKRQLLRKKKEKHLYKRSIYTKTAQYHPFHISTMYDFSMLDARVHQFQRVIILT